MNVQDGLQQDIRPPQNKQVFLTPAQRKTIEKFKRALAEVPARSWLFYLYGADGTGKSWILRQIAQFCHRQTSGRSWASGTVGGNGKARRDSLTSGSVPVAILDFSVTPGDVVRPREPFYGLLSFRRQLARFHIHVPVFDVAALLYMFRMGQLMPGNLRKLFPAEIIPFIYALADLIQNEWKDNTPEIFLDPIERFCRNHTHPVSFDADMAKTSLRKCFYAAGPASLLQILPSLFAADLHLQITRSPAPRQVVFILDHLPGDPLGHRWNGSDMLGRPVFWIHRFVELLLQIPGVMVLLAGTTSDEFPLKPTDAEQRSTSIAFEPLSKDHARAFMQQNDGMPGAIQKTAISLAINGQSQYLPLHLAAGLRLAQILHHRNRHDITEMWARHSDLRVHLVRHLIHAVPRDLAFATIALSAARSFDIKTYLFLGRNLVFNASSRFFQLLRQFPFVESIPNVSPEQYRIHPAFRSTLKAFGERIVRRAHQALYRYYQSLAEQGDASAKAEAIYHLCQFAGERGIWAWLKAFHESLDHERLGESQTLFAVLPELGEIAPFWRAKIFHALARYDALTGANRLALYHLKQGLRYSRQAVRCADDHPPTHLLQIQLCVSLAEYNLRSRDSDAVARYTGMLIQSCDAVLEKSPDWVPALTLKAEGYRLRALAEYQKAGWQESVPYFEKAEKTIRDALHRAPRDSEALRMKAKLFYARGRLYENHMQPKQAEEHYRQAIQSLENIRMPAPDDNRLKCEMHLAAARLLRDRAEFLPAIDQLDCAYQAIDTANRQQPENPRIAILKIRTFIESGWTFWLVSEDQRARECFEAAVRLSEFYLAGFPEDDRFLMYLATVQYLQMLREARPATLQEAKKAAPALHTLVFKLLRQRKGKLPSSPRLQALLIDIGDVLDWHHDTPQAMKVFKQAAGIAGKAEMRNAYLAAERLLKIYEHSDDRDAAEKLILQMENAAGGALPAESLHDLIARISYSLQTAWIDYQHAALEKALQVLERLQPELESAFMAYPENPFLQCCQADLLHLKANIMSQHGRADEAEPLFNMATQKYQYARRTIPGLFDIRFQLCKVYLDWARLNLIMGQYVSASHHLRSLESILEDLQDSGAATDWLQNLTGLMQLEYARLFLTMASYEEASDYLNKAITTFEAYHQFWPDSIEARHNLAISLLMRLWLPSPFHPAVNAHDDYHAALRLLKQSLAKMPGHRLLESNRLMGSLVFSRVLVSEAPLQAQQLLRAIYNEAKAAGNGHRFDMLALQAQTFLLRGKLLLLTQKPVLGAQVLLKADALLEKALECCPANPYLRMLRAEAQFTVGRAYTLHQDQKLARVHFEHAQQIYKTLLDDGFENLEILFGYAETHAQVGFILNEQAKEQEALARLIESLEHFNRCTVKAPKCIDAYRRMGDAHLMVAHLALKARSAESAEDSFKRSISAYDQALKINNADLQTLASKARAHLQYGELCAKRNEYGQSLWQFNQAIQVFETILKMEPEQISARKRLADAFLELGQLHMRSAQYHEAKDNFYNAQKAYSDVIEAMPDDLEARYSRAVSRANLASACVQLSEVEQAQTMYLQAVQDYQSVRECDETFGNTLFNQALSFMALASIQQRGKQWEGAQSNLEKALHALDEWLKLHPEDWSAVREKARATAAIADIYAEKELLESAKIYYERAIKIQQKLFEDEAHALEAALDIAKITERLVHVLEQQRAFKEAVSRLRAAISKLQKLLSVESHKVNVLMQLGALQRHLAILHARENRADAVRDYYRKAFESYHQAFQLNPDDASLRLILQELKNHMKEFS